MFKSQMNVPLKQYAVVSFHKMFLGEDTTTRVFLRPGAVVECHIQSYLEKGYQLYSVVLCNKEQYLNAKVDNCVEDFLDTDREVDRLKDEFNAGNLSLKSYMESLELTDELKRMAARTLYSLMNRLWREGYDCDNETAYELYNYYF